MCRVLAITWAPNSCMFCRADSSSVRNACASAFGGIPLIRKRFYRQHCLISAAFSGLGGKLCAHISAACVETKSHRSLVSLTDSHNLLVQLSIELLAGPLLSCLALTREGCAPNLAKTDLHQDDQTSCSHLRQALMICVRLHLKEGFAAQGASALQRVF